MNQDRTNFEMIEPFAKLVSQFVANDRAISRKKMNCKLYVMAFVWLGDDGKPAKPGSKRRPQTYRGARRNAQRVEYRKQKGTSK